QQQAISEMQAVGLDWVETRDFLPTQHFMVFEKPALAPPQ
ncbi:MAG: SAM-dependent methyltransferase, partial [Gammaproteobacteria bacterium]